MHICFSNNWRYYAYYIQYEIQEKGAVPLGVSKNLYKVKSELKYAMKNYCMEYYFEIGNAGKAVDWNSALHDLQLSFGVKDFMVSIF